MKIRFAFRCPISFVAPMLAITLGLGAFGVPPRPAYGQDLLEARVSKIVDGDTFTLKGQSRRIRIWGLDAPKRDQAGGSAATQALRNLISGQTLRCEVLDIDRYGRLVALCVLPEGRDIAAEMIRVGAATEFCRYSCGYYGTC